MPKSKELLGGVVDTFGNILDPLKFYSFGDNKMHEFLRAGASAGVGLGTLMFLGVVSKAATEMPEYVDFLKTAVIEMIDQTCFPLAIGITGLLVLLHLNLARQD